MKAYCDLHCHSVFSDGTDTPAQLLETACAQGLCALALTDHNTVAGLPDFLAAAQGKDIEAVPGVEFSTDYEGIELHILALYLRTEYFPQVTHLMRQYHLRKEESNRELVEKLAKAGYCVDYERIRAATPKGEANRALIAAELTRMGYTASVKEAFERLLRQSCGYYTPPLRPTPREMLQLIHELGAVSVLAHPYLNLTEPQLEVFLSRAKAWGLQGMEVRYSTYDEQTTRAADAIAARFGLLPSGGSDYHGANKPDISLGTGRRELCVPCEWALRIRENAQK